MRIGSKVYASLGAMSIVACLVGGIGLISLSTFNTISQQADLIAHRASLSAKVDSLINLVVMDSRGIYLSKDADDAQKFVTPMMANLNLLRATVEDWKKLFPQSEQVKFDPILEATQQFIELRQQFVPLAKEGKISEVNALGNNDANRKVRQKLNKEVQVLSASDTAAVENMHKAIGDQYAVATQQVLLTLAIGLILGFIGTAYVVRRQIVGPLEDVSDRISTMTTGDYQSQVPHLSLNNEIGIIAKALKAKDPLMTRIMARAADTLGAACVSLNHVFNTEMFILGGGVIEACGDFILPRIERALKNDPFFKKLQVPLVVAAKLGDDAVMLGAVAAVRQGSALTGAGTPYYPKVRLAPNGKAVVNTTPVDKPLYIRADGKLKEPEEFVPPHLTHDLIDELTKKGPDALFIALGKNKRLVFSAKAARYLKKKHIIARVLPGPAAVKAYNACEERKAVFFYL